MAQYDLQAGGGAYLQGLSAGVAGQVFPLGRQEVHIGRDPNLCQVVLDATTISRLHAIIHFDFQGNATITDKSANGTYINGRKVSQSPLNDGDRVGFGPQGAVAFTYHAARRSQPIPTPPQPEPSVDEMTTQDYGDRPLTGEKGAVTSLLYTARLPMLNIGRAADNQIVLDSPGVSRHHARLVYNGGDQPMIYDVGSTNGTFVNGQLLTQPRPLGPNDFVYIGGFLLRVQGRNIKRYDLGASRISAVNVSKQYGKKVVLKEVSLAIRPREFVGLMGSSGCGKSTLMDALNGLRPASQGKVFVNDLDLYENFDALRRSIGHVPQKDILHEALSVERTLYFAAKLRLPKGTPRAELRRVVDEVIESVGLQEFRKNQFRQLSGGQQKRLSLAIELITKPSFIFLDEPTSPLDPETTENMMELFRRLADQGRIVVMVTHRFEKFELMHHVAILTKGGRLAFFGPPREALAYFDCREPGEVYRRIGARDPDEVGRAFQSSPAYKRYVADRLAEVEQMRPSGARGGAGRVPGGSERRAGLGQWVTLTRRYLEIKLKDVRNTLILLLQAPIIALILGAVTEGNLNDSRTLFIAAVSAIWFGANNAIREIVAEAPIYLRERLVNLKIPSYVFSIFAVLSGLALIQCAMFLGILTGWGRLDGDDFVGLMLIMYLTSLGGAAMGLFFSALVNSTEKAMSVLPLILIPQLLLSGFFKPLDDIYIDPARKAAVTATEYRQSPQTMTKESGLGVGRYAAAAMIARWSVEGLAHVASVGNSTTRQQLATRLYMAEYERVLEGESDSSIRRGYELRVLIDAAVLGGFIVLFLLLTMWALKRKDVL